MSGAEAEMTPSKRSNDRETGSLQSNCQHRRAV